MLTVQRNEKQEDLIPFVDDDSLIYDILLRKVIPPNGEETVTLLEFLEEIATDEEVLDVWNKFGLAKNRTKVMISKSNYGLAKFLSKCGEYGVRFGKLETRLHRQYPKYGTLRYEQKILLDVKNKGYLYHKKFRPGRKLENTYMLTIPEELL